VNLGDTESLVHWVLGLPAGERQRRNLELLASAPLIDLELVSACNIVCRFCPRDDMQRQDARMSEATFDAVERLLPPHAVIMLSGLGDALLHPQLPAWVERLTRSGRAPCVITNGVRLTPGLQDALIEAGIAQVQVSVHSLDPDIARIVVPRGARPGLVVRHLERLAEVRTEGLRVRLNFVETGDNTDQRQAVEALARRLGFDFFYRREHTRGGVNGEARAGATGSGCGIFAAVTFITADGDVLPCVNDVRGAHALGNARELCWGDVDAWKRRVISDGTWFSTCTDCDDDYRWVLIGQGELDEPPPSR
jgi:MoaA/NifB/PqqE/SkfB family radical SAM enzyme